MAYKGDIVLYRCRVHEIIYNTITKFIRADYGNGNVLNSNKKRGILKPEYESNTQFINCGSIYTAKMETPEHFIYIKYDTICIIQRSECEVIYMDNNIKYINGL